jgi:hypothetical protein
MELQRRELDVCNEEQLHFCFMQKEDSQMQSTATLCTYAFRAANDSRNNTPTNKNDKFPSLDSVKPKVSAIKNHHHFRCPVYVLQQEIQNGRNAKKW